MRGVIVSNCEVELEEGFGESNTEHKDKDLVRLKDIFYFLSCVSNHVTMMIFMMRIYH